MAGLATALQTLCLRASVVKEKAIKHRDTETQSKERTTPKTLPVNANERLSPNELAQAQPAVGVRHANRGVYRLLPGALGSAKKRS